MSLNRSVFFVSDRTGITAETLGQSLLTQFAEIPFTQISLPFIDTIEKAERANQQILDAHLQSGMKPIVFSTVVDENVRDILKQADGLVFDFFDQFIGPLELELQAKSSHAIGRSHGMVDTNKYRIRIDAVNFAVNNDDGTTTKQYGKADIILVGVSRTAKTPVSLYLAMQFGIYAANYPLTEDDLQDLRLPSSLEPYREKLYGLSINPDRLAKIRSERRPDSRYASLKQCQYEVAQCEALFRKERIPMQNSTTQSIEEISTNILQNTNVKRRLF